jgi:membrane protease YdiL (CAAX protease family)
VEKVSIGSLTILSWIIGVVLTAALVFLGIMTWEEVLVPSVTMFTPGILLTLMATKLGMTKESVFTPKVFAAIMVSVGFLIADALLLHGLIGLEVTQYDHVLIAVLFAIYEESLFLGIIALLAGLGFPDGYNLLVTGLVFVPLHAFVYPVGWEFTLFLWIGRIVLTGAVLVTDNSDVGFGAHILYNIIANLGSLI